MTQQICTLLPYQTAGKSRAEVCIRISWGADESTHFFVFYFYLEEAFWEVRRRKKLIYSCHILIKGHNQVKINQIWGRCCNLFPSQKGGELSPAELTSINFFGFFNSNKFWDQNWRLKQAIWRTATDWVSLNYDQIIKVKKQQV